MFSRLKTHRSRGLVYGPHNFLELGICGAGQISDWAKPPRSTYRSPREALIFWWFLCQARIDSCGPCFIKQQPKWVKPDGIWRFWWLKPSTKVLVAPEISRCINLCNWLTLADYAKQVQLEELMLTAAFEPTAGCLQLRIFTTGTIGLSQYSYHESAFHSIAVISRVPEENNSNCDKIDLNPAMDDFLWTSIRPSLRLLGLERKNNPISFCCPIFPYTLWQFNIAIENCNV